MSLQRLVFSRQLFTLFLILTIVWGQVLPVATAFAEEVPSEPAPVVESPPAPEPTPTVVESAPTPSEEGTPGEDGENGTTNPETPTAPQDGENGDNTTNPHESAGDGENGDPVDGTPTAGENEPDGVGSEIDTGDASSTATGVNQSNTTTTDVGGSAGSTDDVTLDLDNTIATDSTASSTAETGDNAINDADGAAIDTGHAEAFSYLISLFNIAITNSSGSILFLRNPMASALDFTERIMNIFNNTFAQATSDCSFLGCSLTDAIFNLMSGNVAEVTNVSIARSGTGGNSAESSDGVAMIDTGNTSAFAGIVNFGNLQIVDSRYLIILMTNVGNLAGDIILPPADFFEKLSSGAALAHNTDLDVTNVADITNDGAATADSGANTANAENGGATVDTGDSDANATNLNFVNQIGAPICFIVNVGGEWNGEVEGLPANFNRESTAFGEIICGAGGGEARASNGLTASTTNYAKILNTAIAEAASGGNNAAGLEAAIRTGNADAFVQILNVVNQTIIGQDWIFALFTVSGDWSGSLVFGSVEGEAGSDPIETAVTRLLMSGGGGGAPGGYLSNPQLSVTKTASVVKATAPSKVDYTVVVKNAAGGGAAYRSTLKDVLVDMNGKKIVSRLFELGTIADGEEITLTYTVEYNEAITPGMYMNTATVNGYRNSSIYVYPMTIEPVSGTATVEIEGGGEVATVYEAAPQCTPLITTYMREGGKNDPTDVMKLQKFLTEIEHEEIDDNGIYDSITAAAVKRFQAKYANEVLYPWGIENPTGNVYYTTQRKVNDLACVNGDTFPLSMDQIKEINSFRDRYQQSPSTVNPVIEGVGKSKPVTPDFFSIAPADGGAKILLKQLAPQESDDGISQSHDALGNFSWIKFFVPFVEALEL